MDKRSIRIGVDVGGTNTDICAVDEKTGELMVYKLPSSLHDQSAAVVEGVRVIAEAYGFDGRDVDQSMVLPLVVSKMVAAVSALFLANALAPRFIKEEE